jgi:hypothetical protein
MFQFLSRFDVEKLGSSAAAQCLETKAPAIAICFTRQIFWGNLAVVLARMEAVIDFR